MMTEGAKDFPSGEGKPYGGYRVEGTFQLVEKEDGEDWLTCLDSGKLTFEEGGEVWEGKITAVEWGEGVEKNYRVYMIWEGVIHRADGEKKEKGVWKAVDTGKEYVFLEWIKRDT